MTRKPKILRVIGSMDPTQGGPCQGIRNSIPALETMGIGNEVVSLDDPEAPFLNKDPFKIYAIGPAKGPWGYGSRLIPWLEANLHRYDIVIVHGLWQYYDYAVHKAVLAHKRKGLGPIKLFIMPHGMLDPYFQKAPDRKLKAVRNWFYWKLVEKQVINNADGLLFTCEAELILARETFVPYAPKAELNVGYGIQEPPPFQKVMTDAFAEKCGMPKKTPYFLFLSRIHEKKGVDLLVEAFIENFKEDGPKLVIAGPGLDTPYGEKIRAMSKGQNKVRDSIFFPGMLSGDAKWGAFYGCDAFILPSHQENFGIAVVEALACGKPVLISDQVNIWKEIAAQGAGLVATDTVSGTKDLLQEWHRMTKNEKQDASKKAKRTYEEYFTVQKAAERMLSHIT